VNLYLQRFVAGFRIDSITSSNTRDGPACSCNVVINNTQVPIAGGEVAPGEPSFRNTLSAGDRNTLALAFFFASVDQDPELANKVVVIDDPISSLDEHRALTTVQEMRRLGERVRQVIVLSHGKPFLCSLWEGADAGQRAALEVCRDGPGSSLRAWDVSQDCITEHDRRHAMLREHLVTAPPNKREVAPRDPTSARSVRARGIPGAFSAGVDAGAVPEPLPAAARNVPADPEPRGHWGAT
jgi:hypothetical protein